MKTIIITAVALALVGCGINPVKPEHQTVKETHFIVAVPPKECSTLPDQVADIDVDKADQAIVSEWLLRKEKYLRDMEDLNICTMVFLVGEQAKLDAAAKAFNAAAIKAAEEYDANAAKRAKAKPVELNAQPSR